jgi:hypothetical protein
MCPDGAAAVCTGGSTTGKCGPDSNVMEPGICTTGAEGNAQVTLAPNPWSFPKVPEGSDLSDLDEARANNLDVLDVANPNLKNEGNDLQATITAEITGNTVAEELAAVKAFDDDTWTEFTDPDQKTQYLAGDEDHLYDDKGNLKVNGLWGGWGPIGACSTNCGCGIRYRYRSCDSPAPAFGGLDCTGGNAASDSCNCGNPCPTPAPTPAPPTPVPPTPAPTPHPCLSGNHPCDKGAGGICVHTGNKHDPTSPHFACHCAAWYNDPAVGASAHVCGSCGQANEVPCAPRHGGPISVDACIDGYHVVGNKCILTTNYPSPAPTVAPTLAPTNSPTKAPTPAPTYKQCSGTAAYPDVDLACRCECHGTSCAKVYVPYFSDTRRRRRGPTYTTRKGYYCHHDYMFGDSRRRWIKNSRRRKSDNRRRGKFIPE